MTDDRDSYLYAMMRDQLDTPLSEEKRLRILDIGSDVRIMFTTREGSDAPMGLIESHPGIDGAGCEGSVTFDVPEAEGIGGPRWTLHSLDPLHIEPSVLCRRCGHHGWIRNGQWVNA